MNQPIYPKVAQKQLWRLLGALQRGERISTLSAMLKYRVGAASQRFGELRMLGWDIRSESMDNDEEGFHFEWFLAAPARPSALDIQTALELECLR